MGAYSGLSLYWPELTADELRRVLVELEEWVAWARVARATEIGADPGSPADPGSLVTEEEAA